MSNKPLSVLTDELEVLLDKQSKAREKMIFMLSPKFCGMCSKKVTKIEELEILFETGMCGRCDHSYGENLDEIDEGYESFKDYNESNI